MDILILILACASLILHFVAPKTKTTVDDTAAEAVDVVKGALESRK